METSDTRFRSETTSEYRRKQIVTMVCFGKDTIQQVTTFYLLEPVVAVIVVNPTSQTSVYE